MMMMMILKEYDNDITDLNYKKSQETKKNKWQKSHKTKKKNKYHFIFSNFRKWFLESVIRKKWLYFCCVAYIDAGNGCNFHYNQYTPGVDMNFNYKRYINEYAIKNELFYF